ncbi:MAG: Ni/Fe hydrogenase subunit alpha [Gammaproteobacteria bacterium]|nr:Ni/Fe hydrogenase subunit alpha [Gammaproteobacteria bacterium]
MNKTLETAADREKLNRYVIEPVSRVEGHGKVTLLADDDNNIQEVRMHIVEFRGFERFIQGRHYREMPIIVQRLCGICPVSHHLAAGKAIDMIAGVDQLTPTADKLRNLVHFGQVLQSHALHLFHLSSPDLLFGFESDIQKRNVIAVIKEYPELALQGVKLRKYGQEIIRIICGKRVHGTGAIPGGMNKALSSKYREYLLKDISQILEWSKAAVALVYNYFTENLPTSAEFGTMDTNYLSLVNSEGGMELYDGAIRVKDKQGNILHDQLNDKDYFKYIREEVKNWSYMKFPYLIDQGTENGWYRVGPLARMNNCDFIPTPLAETERQKFAQYAAGKPVHSTMAFHWARMIELLHCAENIEQLLLDPEIMGTDILTKGERRNMGVGVIEAPRGTLFHHYEVDDDDLIKKANLIVSTTSNNQAMNESIRQVASTYMNGKEITEPLLNNIEVAIRAYDPCLSCATHAVGKMPLKVELRHQNGDLIHQLSKSSSGQFE